MNVNSVSDEKALHMLLDYEWHGNVRELEHIIEGSMNLMEHEEQLTYSFLPIPFRNKPQFQSRTTTKNDLEGFAYSKRKKH